MTLHSSLLLEVNVGKILSGHTPLQWARHQRHLLYSHYLYRTYVCSTIGDLWLVVPFRSHLNDYLVLIGSVWMFLWYNHLLFTLYIIYHYIFRCVVASAGGGGGGRVRRGEVTLCIAFHTGQLSMP